MFNNTIGQAVAYMRRFKLRYYFLSTYKSTAFIKREDDFCFRLSMPISEDATDPPLRECFAGFAAIDRDQPGRKAFSAYLIAEKVLFKNSVP
jgi:hypothetical protein